MKTLLADGVHVWHNGFTFRLAPTADQTERFAREAGVRRFVFNWALALIGERQELWAAQRDAGVPGADRVPLLGNRELHDLFKDSLPDWWPEADPVMWTYRHAIDDAVTAHRRWLKGDAKFPRFSKKGRSRPRFSAQGSDVELTEAGVVRLPKAGWVAIAGSPGRLADLRRRLRRGRAKLLRVTVSCHADGSWWVSGSIEHQARTNPQPDPAVADVIVGADRGVKTNTVAAGETGHIIAVLPSLTETRREQRALARTDRAVSRRHRRGARSEDQSSNYRKACKRRGRLYERARRRRHNRIHNLTRTLTNQAAVVVLDTVPTTMMLRNQHLARTTASQAHWEIQRQLAYKLPAAGGTLIIAHRFYPSSKRCSNCTNVKPKLRLSERTYSCEHCGLTIDRDLNAAINLAAWGKAMLSHPELTAEELTKLLCHWPDSQASSPTPAPRTQRAGQEAAASMPGVGGRLQPTGESRTAVAPAAHTTTVVQGDMPGTVPTRH